MKNTTIPPAQMERARTRVNQLKGFYKHLIVYLLVNGGLLLFAKKTTFILLGKEAIGNPEFFQWINWNVYGTTIIWGIVLMIHAVYVFVPSPFKTWEERKINAYMAKDKEETNRFISR